MSRNTETLASRLVAELARVTGYQPMQYSGAGEKLTAFCCHRSEGWPHSWCSIDAPRFPAPSMPVRKYYFARR
jgi:hypothetical protein